MREFIARQNIAHYQEQLSTERESAKRTQRLLPTRDWRVSAQKTPPDIELKMSACSRRGVESGV